MVRRFWQSTCRLDFANYIGRMLEGQWTRVPYLSLDFDGVVLLLDALQDLGLLLDEGVRAVEEAAVVERQEPGVVLFEPGKTRPG